MRSTTLALRCGVCVGAIAAAAGAQDEMTFYWEITDNGNQDGMVCDGECALLTLYAQMDPHPGLGFAGAIYDIVGDGRWADGEIKDHDNLLGSLTGEGIVQPDNDITEIEALQLPPIFNPNFDASNPIALYTIAWQPNDYTPGIAVIDTVVYSAHVYVDDFTTAPYTPISVAGEIVICPSPAASALLLGGAGLATRRRRA